MLRAMMKNLQVLPPDPADNEEIIQDLWHTIRKVNVL